MPTMIIDDPDGDYFYEVHQNIGMTHARFSVSKHDKQTGKMVESEGMLSFYRFAHKSKEPNGL